MKKLLFVLSVSLVGSVAVFMMTSAANADDVECSDTAGVIAGDVNHNIIVDVDCTVSPGATVNGDLKQEDSAATWNINVSGSANIKGNILNKGSGTVAVNVGQHDLFDGSIKDEGTGSVILAVDGGTPPRPRYNGNIEESGSGNVTVNIGVPGGQYNGNILEKDAGNLTLNIGAGPPGPSGDMNGNVREEGDGTCTVTAPPGQPRGNKEEDCA
jgi:hypothetical protein